MKLISLLFATILVTTGCGAAESVSADVPPGSDSGTATVEGGNDSSTVTGTNPGDDGSSPVTGDDSGSTATDDGGGSSGDDGGSATSDGGSPVTGGDDGGTHSQPDGGSSCDDGNDPSPFCEHQLHCCMDGCKDLVEVPALHVLCVQGCERQHLACVREEILFLR